MRLTCTSDLVLELMQLYKESKLKIQHNELLLVVKTDKWLEEDILQTVNQLANNVRRRGLVGTLAYEA